MGRRKLILRPGGAAATTAEDDGPAKMTISPSDSVFSYVLFMCPLERARSGGRFTWHMLTAYALVALSLLLQGTILFGIFEAVVTADVDWKQSIMGKPKGGAMSFLVDDAPTTCNDGSSLCVENNGTFTCAPPSVQLTGRWDELDTDGDGIWTKDEVVAARDKLKCRYVVDPVEVFNVFVRFLVKREHIIWIHPDVRAGKMIPKSYFTYAVGDLVMCGYRNDKMCANLLERGVFDAPLKYGTAPRVGTTIESALDYCFDLLQDGGTCERTLPSTYSVWKKSSEEQCLGASYDKFVYEHPTSGITKSMLTVNYNAVKDYEMATYSYLFLIFKTIIIALFTLAMYTELRDILVIATWVLTYPSADSFDGNEVKVVKSEEDASDTKYVIQATSQRHRLVMAMVTLLRLIMVSVLWWVGITFLMKDTDWVNLLLNGVALVFVVEIAYSIFSQVVDPNQQEEFLGSEPICVEHFHGGVGSAHPALRDFMGFLALMLVVVLVMSAHTHQVGTPLSYALECACLSQGGHCREAHSFNDQFWTTYWTEDVPRSIDDIKAMKAGGPLVPRASPSSGRTVSKKERTSDGAGGNDVDEDDSGDGGDDQEGISVKPERRPQTQRLGEAVEMLRHRPRGAARGMLNRPAKASELEEGEGDGFALLSLHLAPEAQHMASTSTSAVEKQRTLRPVRASAQVRPAAGAQARH